MSKRTFALTNLAKQDLKDLAIFTHKRWGREQRNTYLKQINETFHLLAEKPEIGRQCDELIEGYIKFPQGSHMIYYKKDKKRILVVRILHKSMDVNPSSLGA